MNSQSAPTLSILMLAYNHEAFVSDAIESIIRQNTSIRYELLIGEDQSSDNTLKTVQYYASEYPDIIRVLPSDRKYGLGDNLRRLIANASSEYIAFCEGDDIWLDNGRIDFQVSALRRNPGASFVYGSFDRILLCNGEWRVFRQACRQSQSLLDHGFILEDLMDRIDIHLSTIMCRTLILKEYINSIFYDSSLWLGDVPMFLYLASKGRALSVQQSVSIYRHHPESITQSSSSSKLQVVRDHVKVVKVFENLLKSDPARSRNRIPILRKMLADAAYSDAEIFLFLSNARISIANLLRLIIMLIKPLHHFWIYRALQLARIDFHAKSERFQIPAARI